MLEWLNHFHFSAVVLTALVCFITGFIPTIGTEVFFGFYCF